MTPTPGSFLLQKAVYGGDCLALTQESQGKPGKAVFIPFTLPGETVQARIIEEKRGFAKAELETITEASPNRVEPSCPHYGVCGGCHYQHADYPTQLAIKQQILRETLDRAGVKRSHQIEVFSDSPWGYRNRIRLAVTPDGQIGYRSRRSHEIVPIRECPITAPVLIQTALQIADGLGELAALVSELELFTDADQSQILLTLFAHSAPTTDPTRRLDTLRTAIPSLNGIRLQTSNIEPPSRSHIRSGASSLTYTAAGLQYQVPQGAFFQVNRNLLDGFVSLVTGSATGDSAWDLYAGVGLFARRLAASFREVQAVESSPDAFPALEQNLAQTRAKVASSTTLDFLRHNRLERQPRPDFVVLDPPRAGLGEKTTTLLNAIGAPQMVYVSCDPTTLARDLYALTAERYAVESITSVDMFPQTFHLENVVRLRRA